MSDQPAPPRHAFEGGGLARLVIAGLFAGGLAGLVGSLFRLLLRQAEVWRHAMLAWAQVRPTWGWLVPVVVVGLAAGFARWLVRRLEPSAAGSGIPQIEAVLREQGQLDSPLVLPVKFVGGAVAIGAGLALGREGPTVQMGAAAAQLVGRAFRVGPGDIRSLVAAGSGAGLAAAFGAPLGGAVFVLEELVQRFDLRVLVATLSACSAGIAVCYQFLGTRPVFTVALLPPPGFFHFVFYLALGVPLGLLGVAYNRMIVRGLNLTDRLGGARSDLGAMAIGAGIGLLGWFIPAALGSGEELVQRLLQSGRQTPVLLLLGLLLVRFVVGPVSYATQTPGGLFAPLLVVGATLGAACGTVVHDLFPEQLPDPTALTVVGMAGFFAATVRAPITGMALTLELTAVSSLFVPMLATCAVAMAVPTLLGDPPIYDALRKRARQRSGAAQR